LSHSIKGLTPAFYTEQGRVRTHQPTGDAGMNSQRDHSMLKPDVERDQTQPPIRSQTTFSHSWDWVYTSIGEVMFSASS